MSPSYVYAHDATIIEIRVNGRHVADGGQDRSWVGEPWDLSAEIANNKACILPIISAPIQEESQVDKENVEEEHLGGENLKEEDLDEEDHCPDKPLDDGESKRRNLEERSFEASTPDYRNFEERTTKSTESVKVPGEILLWFATSAL